MSAINKRSLNVVWWILRVKIFDVKKGILLPDTVSWHLPRFTRFLNLQNNLHTVSVNSIHNFGSGVTSKCQKAKTFHTS